MILLDKVLLGAIIILTPPLVFLIVRLIMKDPVRWFGGWRNRRFWVVTERLESEENIGLLSRRKKRKKDQRRRVRSG